MLEVVEFVALVAMLAVAWRPVWRTITGALDGRARKIREELDEAQRLHEEAKAMLARYQRQLHEGEGLAKDILDRAETERKRLEAKMRSDLEQLTERRTRQAIERIEQEEAQAVAEVRARVADLSVRATRAVLTERLQGEQVTKVMQGAVEEVRSKLA